MVGDEMNTELLKKLASHFTWVVPLLPILVLSTMLLMLWVSKRLNDAVLERTGMVDQGATTTFQALIMAIVILMPVSVVIGIVMLIVLLVKCLRKKLSWTGPRTLISAGFAVVDILLPVSLVIIVAIELQRHPIRFVW